MHRSNCLAVVCLLSAGSLLLADDIAAARATLKSKGFQQFGVGRYVLKGESEFAKKVRELDVQGKRIKAEEDAVTAAEKRLAAGEKRMRVLETELAHLNKQLNRPGIDVAENNRIVGEMNAKTNELNRLHRERVNPKTEAKPSGTLRRQYVQQVIELRVLADRVQAEYAAAAQDDEVVTALTEIRNARKPGDDKVVPKPSPEFTREYKRFEKMEKTVVSDTIPLDVQGRTSFIDVAINGRPPLPMVYDTGCSTVSIPPAMAARLGIEPTGELLNFSVADGRTAKGHLVKLDSIRVGKFVVNDVEAAILQGNDDSPALIGMSFFQHFQHTHDSSSKTLKLVKIEATGIESDPAAKSAKPTRKARKSSKTRDDD